ncbi:bifunctional adenosylcobinamide kinase/adenosylcobinamide-phosphate guanylyltransferase [Pandoraea terrae]|uniref:Bifunctional adenosylcobalamin biosynthesis protein n=1 Tax=Pandoraea terrae TaxID=1537710 RepID=A0A5E4RKI2_9BURK|nr:bifunctional adenosylcobinamide kinase/adenosylcobinamide-phosphate guanylyltransferase [Pandoraea terrae]VVD63331.1 bifunctional adenosylcobinamide kinase/adenosylcobinamide-phosphate guanylyltransferase [Pandoraea terrae]
MSSHNLTFVLGGARSGKSAFAEQLAHDSALPVTYIATALDTGEREMRERIAHHRARRPAHWTTVEAGLDLAGAIAHAARPDHCVIVDCLPLWLAGWLCPPGARDDTPFDDGPWLAACAQLETALATAPGQRVVVSNEIGMGVIPMGALTRRYVDELGRLNQRIAAVSDRVRFVVAGLPMAVKG